MGSQRVGDDLVTKPQQQSIKCIPLELNIDGTSFTMHRLSSETRLSDPKVSTPGALPSWRSQYSKKDRREPSDSWARLDRAGSTNQLGDATEREGKRCSFHLGKHKEKVNMPSPKPSLSNLDSFEKFCSPLGSSWVSFSFLRVTLSCLISKCFPVITWWSVPHIPKWKWRRQHKSRQLIFASTITPVFLTS